MELFTTKHREAFRRHLEQEEHSRGTVEKYLRDVQEFAVWLDGRPLSREAVSSWRGVLLSRGRAPVTVNSKLAALNAYFRLIGREECRVRSLRLQRRLFRESKRELNRSEYSRLVCTAQELGKERLSLLLETICATGIRVSEVRYITAEAAKSGQAEIALKGKIRIILLPRKLCRKLQEYARKQKIASGEIFLTRSGNSLSRKQIWAEMKALCQVARVEPAKVFPHNLRHLFAVVFYRSCRDLARLADVLGHSSVDTTRIYLMTTGEEHTRQLDQLRLVS